MDAYETALNDLISRARRRGGFTMEDLREAFPIDSMTVEDISRVLARLEQAGFDLEIDPSLLVPKHKAAPQVAAPVPTPDETENPKPLLETRRQSASLPTSSTEPTGSHAAGRSASSPAASMLPWIVAFAIVVVAVFAAFAF